MLGNKYLVSIIIIMCICAGCFRNSFKTRVNKTRLYMIEQLESGSLIDWEIFQYREILSALDHLDSSYDGKPILPCAFYIRDVRCSYLIVHWIDSNPIAKTISLSNGCAEPLILPIAAHDEMINESNSKDYLLNTSVYTWPPGQSPMCITEEPETYISVCNIYGMSSEYCRVSFVENKKVK